MSLLSSAQTALFSAEMTQELSSGSISKKDDMVLTEGLNTPGYELAGY